MNREELKQAIEVMQHYADGGQVEVYLSSVGLWAMAETPDWNLSCVKYRKAVTKPSIDWSHVHPDFKYLATDEEGRSFCFIRKPTKHETFWFYFGYISAELFSSFKPGTCDWKDSLVKRPDQDETK